MRGKGFPAVGMSGYCQSVLEEEEEQEEEEEAEEEEESEEDVSCLTGSS